MKKKPTDRELGIILREITGRMPGMPHNTGAVRITKTTYNGADRFELTWRDEANTRRKLWYRNWRHALAAAKWANAQLEAAKGKTAFTFNDAADAWIKHCEQRVRAADMAERTVYNYRLHLKQIQQRFGRVLLHDIKTRDLNDWLLKEGERLKHTSLDARRGIIRHVLRYAYERDMLVINPLVLRPLKLPGKKTKHADRPDPSDMEKLREYLDGPRPFGNSRVIWSCTRVAVALGGSCGLRAEEICGLRWDDIDPNTGELDIKHAIVGKWGSSLKLGPTKTEASRRKVQTTFRVRKILDEHAILYKDLFGKCIGYVIRSTRPNCLHDFIPPHELSSIFRRALRRAGLVKEDGKSPKFSLHKLRHWSASSWVKHLDIHRVSKMLGHSNASMTLDTYGYYIDDPDTREKFERMPDWLDPPIEIGASSRQPALPAPEPSPIEVNGGGVVSELAPPLECPIPVPDHAERWLRQFLRDLWRHGHVADALLAIRKDRNQVRKELQRLQLPTVGELEGMAAEAIEARSDAAIGVADVEMPPPAIIAGAHQEPPCPIDVPDMAPPWLRIYIRLLDEGLSQNAACRQIRRPAYAVRKELARLKMPDQMEIRRRLKIKKVAALAEQGYQNHEIAAMLGYKSRATPQLVRQDLHIEGPAKQLKTINKERGKARAMAQAEHKRQLKLL